MKVKVNAVETVVRDVNVEVNPKSAVFDIRKALFHELEKSISVRSFGVKSKHSISSFYKNDKKLFMRVCKNDGYSHGGHYDEDHTYYEIDITEAIECSGNSKRFHLLLEAYTASVNLYGNLWDLEILDINNK